MSSKHRVALTTAGSAEQAKSLAQELVRRRLAACVNVVPGVCSFYRWKGELVEEGERLLVIKTDAGRLEDLQAAIRELHSYETPELIVLEVAGGDPAYLAWVDASLAGDDKPEG